MTRTPQVFGHRGSRGTHPENTLAAFQHAIDAGADGVELDVTVSRDDVLVVTHDLVQRGAPVRSADWAHWRGTLPRIEEVLALNAGRPFVFDIEMKSDARHPEWTPGSKAFAKLVIQEIENACVRENCIVRSFDPELLRAVRDLDSILPLAALYDDNRADAVADAVTLEAQILSPEYHLITPELVRQAHAANLEVSAWTVNAPEEWARLAELGVDTIITDDPAALVSYYACFSASGPTTGSTTD